MAFGMYVEHKTPCGECPFRRASAPGWLGADTPEGFMDHINKEVDLPCHAKIDYEDEDWRMKADVGARCAGSLIFMRNSIRLPRRPELLKARTQVETDHATVFSHTGQFLEHHRSLSCQNDSSRRPVVENSAVSVKAQQNTKSKKRSSTTNRAR